MSCTAFLQTRNNHTSPSILTTCIITIHFNAILPLGFPSGLFFSAFLTKILYAFLVPPTCTTFPAQLIFINYHNNSSQRVYIVPFSPTSLSVPGISCVCISVCTATSTYIMYALYVTFLSWRPRCISAPQNCQCCCYKAHKLLPVSIACASVPTVGERDISFDSGYRFDIKWLHN